MFYKEITSHDFDHIQHKFDTMSEPPSESASERTRSRERTRVQEDAPVRGVSLDPEGQVPARDIAPNSSETGRAAAAVPEVSTSTGRIPRNQDEFQQQSNQSQRSRFHKSQFCQS